MNWKLFIFVGFAFAFVTILALAQINTKISFELITFPQFAPTLAYLFTILLFRDLHIPIKINFNKTILAKSFIAILFPLALFTIAYFIGTIIGIESKIQNNLFSIIIVSLFGIVIGAIAEEIGWRSFFQPRLEQKHSVFISSIIVGLIWGIWHIGHYQNGLIFMLGFIVFTISFSIIVVYLQKDTKNNLIIPSLFHVSINIGGIIYFYDEAFIFVNIQLVLINSIVWLIAAIIITICGRRYYFVKAK